LSVLVVYLSFHEKHIKPRLRITYHVHPTLGQLSQLLSHTHGFTPPSVLLLLLLLLKLLLLLLKKKKLLLLGLLLHVRLVLLARAATGCCAVPTRQEGH